MSDRDEDLRSFILSDPAVAVITQTLAVNDVPEETSGDFIWMREARVERDDICGEAARDWLVGYDIECCSTSLDQAKALRKAVADRLEGHNGELVPGGSRVSWMSVADQYDDYVPRMLEADEHLQIGSLYAEVTL